MSFFVRRAIPLVGLLIFVFIFPLAPGALAASTPGRALRTWAPSASTVGNSGGTRQVLRPRTAARLTLGVNVAGDPNPQALDAYSAAAGRPPAMVMWYQSWSEPLYWDSQMAAVNARGLIPVITWMPQVGAVGVPLRDIASGAWDSYLSASAQQAKAYGKPMMIRFAHEMNLPGSAYGPRPGGNTPADFIAAWRHVVQTFRSDGVSNVQWVWSPNVDCYGRCPFTAFYPGDDVVDWVALDGYNYGAVTGMPWQSLATIFSSSYASITALTSKPLMIGETASTEVGGDKAAWIRQGFLYDIPRLMPRVRAVVWFDRDKESDWRVDSSSASLAAWRDVVSSPLYQGVTRRQTVTRR